MTEWLSAIGPPQGVLFTYIWGLWEDCSDRFPGHPESIETIVVVDEVLAADNDADRLCCCSACCC